MASSDYNSSIAARPSIGAQSIALSTTVNGAEIDTRGWRFATVVVSTGAIAAAGDGSFTLESATSSGGSFSAITGATGTILSTDDNDTLRGFVDLDQQSRFVRVVITSGAGDTTFASAMVILSGPNNTDTALTAADAEAFSVLF